MNEHVIADGPMFVRLRWTPAVAGIFREHNVSFGDRATLPYLEIAKTAIIEEYCDFTAAQRINSSGFGSYSMSGTAELAMGRYCSIANGSSTFGERHPIEHATTSSFLYRVQRPALLKAWRDLLPPDTRPISPTISSFPPATRVGHDVWVGQGAQIARNINIGIGAVIAAGAIITKDVPSYAIVGGIDNIKKFRFPEKTVYKLLLSEWWTLHPRHIVDKSAVDPDEFLDHIAACREKDGVFHPRTLTVPDILERLTSYPNTKPA